MNIADTTVGDQVVTTSILFEMKKGWLLQSREHLF